tara:strand:- start:3559 stop:6069 length:2511 start_codon:yes stop_codon:yes gene_type:complete
MEMGMFMSSYEYKGVGKVFEAGRLCNLTVTQPNQKNDYSIQNPHMIGFPKVSMYKYIPLLLKNNYSVVWIEQTDGDKKTSKIRKKTRVFTPGTFFEEPLTSQDYNICCIHSIDEITHYVVIVDTSVGKVDLITLDDIKNLNWLCCVYKPYEVLFLCDDQLYDKVSTRVKQTTKAIYLKSIHNNQQFFMKPYQINIIERAYTNLRAFNDISITHLPCIACLFHFIELCHESAIHHLQFPKEQSKQNMSLHNNAIVQLDVVETSRGGGLFSIVNRTSTPMGSRLLYKQLTNPMINVRDICEVYSKVEDMIPCVEKVNKILKGIPDLDRKIKRLCNACFSIQEIVNLYHIFQNILNLYEYDEYVIQYVQHIETFVRSFINIETESFISPNELVEQQYRRDTLLKEFEEYIRCITNGHDFELKLDLQSKNVYTTPKRANLLKTILKIKKKRTNVVDVTNDKIEQYLFDYERENEAYEDLFKKTITTFQKNWYTSCQREMMHLSRVVANVDVIKARAICAIEYNYTKPTVEQSNSSYIYGEDIRHPIIERQDNVNYVANDVALDKGMLLYGINGAGKSSYGRAVALNIILAQSGFYVPAKSFRYSPYERIFTRIGSDDNMYEGLSSFWLEISEMNGILRSGNHRSLVIGDELFKGTEDVSAIALVSACLHWLSSNKISFIFATHLHKLPSISIVKELNLNIMHMQSKYCKQTKTIVFNRKWCKGQGDSNYGIEVAEHILDDPTIINNAKLIRHELCGTKKKNQGKQSKYNKNVIVNECGHCKSTTNLHTHHIQPQKNGVNNKSSNLIPLCDECHTKIHTNRLSHQVLDTVNGPLHVFNETP